MRMLVGAVWLTISSMSLAQQAPMLNQTLLREAMEFLVKNPSSAKFEEVTYKRGREPNEWTMCGRVSVKNSYGSYADFERFVGMVIIEEMRPHYLVHSVGGLSDKLCQLEGL